MALHGSHSVLIHEILDDLLTFQISRPGVSISKPIVFGLETGGFSSIVMMDLQSGIQSSHSEPIVEC